LPAGEGGLSFRNIEPLAEFHSDREKASGHDFSRAYRATRLYRALAHAVLFSVIYNSAAAEAGIKMAICGTTEQAAEKLGVSGEIGEKHPSGAKAHVHFAALTARLNRLRKRPEFRAKMARTIPQGLKPDADSIGIKPGINPRPTARQEFFRSL
jgi:hypothetical protein